MVFRISFLVIVLLAAAAGLAPARFAAVVSDLLGGMLANTGWLYLLVVFATLLFMLYLAFGSMGELRIGGEDAEPHFSVGSWLAMLFAAGMGIGLVFWGAAEPLSHYFNPPEGLEPRSMASARAAMRYSFFHWGLHPWAIYALVGLAMAWFQYNRRGRGQLSDLLQPILGRHHRGWAGHCVDIAAVVATAIGVATTLGFGALQIVAGLATVFGTPSGTTMQLVVIAVAFVLYMASSLSGVERGIKWLSSFNLALAALLMLLVLALGPTAFLFDVFTNALGGYLDRLVGMSLRMSPFSGSAWVSDWTIFYWAWWISWAPFVGTFIARVSYGRTIREFVVGSVLAPSLLGFAWFAVFGGTALWQQLFVTDLRPVLESGYQNVLFALFEQLPGSTLLSGVAVLLLVIFFITSADSAVLVLASMSSEHAGDPPPLRRLAWGVAIAVVAAALLLAGGLDALQGLVTISALPFALLLALVILAMHRTLAHAREVRRRRAQQLRHALEHWVYGPHHTRGPAPPPYSKE
ncbi:BCCT family transporter [Pseudoxanthomonas suwonensis]|uniref:BCCT family transporter n=1 Tax=Pseudoxanthomonas suwonensis TaxID=314722 RepID=UPI0004902EE3|nr:BCCT family transporter [Pseudoxanthomonas suwonensis]